MVSRTNRLQRQRIEAVVPAAESLETTRLREASADAQAVQSPARRLQLELEQNWSANAAPRWPARRALTFIVATNLVLWAALIAGLRAVL